MVAMGFSNNGHVLSRVYRDATDEEEIAFARTIFDHDKFWNVMRVWSKDNLVFISEETAPSDFKCIWKKKYARGKGLSKSGRTVYEKLFVYHINHDKVKGRPSKKRHRTIRKRRKKRHRSKK